MHAKQRPEFVTIIAALAATFGKEASEPLLTGYWMGLSDLELSALKTAATRAMREKKFMPTVAELRELAGDIGPEQRAVIAWDAVKSANREHSYAATVDFDDRAINAAIRNMGGWEQFTERIESDEVWARKDFERIYQVYNRRGVTASEGAALPGFHARVNAFNGHREGIPESVRIATTLSPTRLLGREHASPGTIGVEIVGLLEHVGTMPEGTP
jgi:hypothetical protein